MKTILSLILLTSLSSCVVSPDPGEGRKIGQIVKLSKSGLLFKTWEGELIRGGMIDGSGTIGGTFKFTIEDDTTALLAMECLESQKEVILHYRVEFISIICRSSSFEPHFITRIVTHEK